LAKANKSGIKYCVNVSFYPKKTKYSSEDKVALRTLKLFFKYLFFSLFISGKINKHFVIMFCKFFSKIIMFQETLQLWEIIVLPLNKQTIVKLIGCMPPPLIWHISQIIVDCISLLMYVYVLNQSCDHWLLSDASHSTLTMSFKLKEEIKIPPFANNLMEDNSKLVIELALFASI
jgi:hypothetical protein